MNFTLLKLLDSGIGIRDEERRDKRCRVLPELFGVFWLLKVDVNISENTPVTFLLLTLRGLTFF